MTAGFLVSFLVFVVIPLSAQFAFRNAFLSFLFTCVVGLSFYGWWLSQTIVLQPDEYGFNFYVNWMINMAVLLTYYMVFAVAARIARWMW